MKNSISILALLGGALLAAPTMAQDCGNVSIANMNWQSGEVLAHIDKIILEAGYGCSVELVAGDTVPSITSMVEKGQPDVVPEGWVNSVPEIVNRGIQEKRIMVASEPLTDGGVQGLWIPKYFAEAHPDIKTIKDVLAHPELFPSPEDSSKGGIVTSPQGWGAATIISQLFKANGGEAAGFLLIDPGSSAGLDGSLSRAYTRKEPWVGYYWSPTALIGKYPMVRVDLGAPLDDAEWKRCITVDGCPDPEPTEWPRDTVQTLVTTEFAARAGEPMTYLKKRGWSNDVVSQISAYMTDNQATGEDGAKYFLENHPDVWTAWVSPEVAEKVKEAL